MVIVAYYVTNSDSCQYFYLRTCLLFYFILSIPDNIREVGIMVIVVCHVTNLYDMASLLCMLV